MDLLKNDKLDETVLIESLEKSLNYFQSLYNIHLADRKTYDHNKLLTDFVTLMKSASDAAHLDITILQNICSDFEVLNTISTCIDDIDQFCKKIKRRLSSETKLKLEESVENEICDCITIINRVINALKLVRINAMQIKKECDAKQLEKIATEVGGFKFINDSLQSVMTICCQFSTALQQGLEIAINLLFCLFLTFRLIVLKLH
jgi:predicted house-cleaning noncanonical NTP pyrophosphatase (MazG superfamily)